MIYYSLRASASSGILILDFCTYCVDVGDCRVQWIFNNAIIPILVYVIFVYL